MKFYLMTHTYDSYGGHSTLSLIPDFILTAVPPLGAAIKELVVILNFPTSGPPKPTLEGTFAEYGAARKALPKVEFRRSRETAKISVASELLNGADWRFGVLSSALFRNGFAEAVAALGLLKLRLTNEDDFSLTQLLKHCKERESFLPEDDDALVKLKSEIEARRAAMRALLSPWERLDIDWRDFHADSRRILDDPFYWSGVDNFAPHGNDTGHDLLSDYREWLENNQRGDSLVFYERLIKGWGFSLENPDEMARRVMDEAVVALAFAELKLKGACSRQVADLAIKAAQRQRQEALAAADWPHRGDRLRSLDLIEAKLQSTS